MSILVNSRRNIPLHRSVRMVAFRLWHLLFWMIFALLSTFFVARSGPIWTEWYARVVERLLGWGGLPFERGAGAPLWNFRTPSWALDSFNPAAAWNGALIFLAIGVLALLIATRLKRLPFPASAWLGLSAGLLLLSTGVLYLLPQPRLTPESFSALWGQVSLGTLLIFPLIWAMLVGTLPVPPSRVLFFGLSAMLMMGVWSACRLALSLAIAHWAGEIWLPVAFILACSIPDFLVLIVAFGLTIEPAGFLWGEGV
jgi:hypothetical protein